MSRPLSSSTPRKRTSSSHSPPRRLDTSEDIGNYHAEIWSGFDDISDISYAENTVELEESDSDDVGASTSAAPPPCCIRVRTGETQVFSW